MKQRLLLIIAIAISFTSFSQIYVPPNPTIYGHKFNRVKALYALHLPEKDTLELSTSDSTAQIFFSRHDSSAYFWSILTGYVKLGSSTGGGTWGSITGTLSDQGDLQTALNAKVPTTRTLTINGTAFDLSTDRSWNVVSRFGIEDNLFTADRTVDFGGYRFLWDSLRRLTINLSRTYLSDSAFQIKLGETNLVRVSAIDGFTRLHGLYVANETYFGSSNTTSIDGLGNMRVDNGAFVSFRNNGFLESFQHRTRLLSSYYGSDWYFINDTLAMQGKDTTDISNLTIAFRSPINDVERDLVRFNPNRVKVFVDTLNFRDSFKMYHKNSTEFFMRAYNGKNVNIVGGLPGSGDNVILWANNGSSNFAISDSAGFPRFKAISSGNSPLFELRSDFFNGKDRSVFQSKDPTISVGVWGHGRNYGASFYTDSLTITMASPGTSTSGDSVFVLGPPNAYGERKGRLRAQSDVVGAGSPLSDGDYGDIIVSASGSNMEIDADVVTNTKLDNMPANTIKGNNTGSTADPDDLTVSEVSDMLGIEDLTVDNDLDSLIGGSPKYLKSIRVTATDPVVITPTITDSTILYHATVRQSFLDSVRAGDFGGGVAYDDYEIPEDGMLVLIRTDDTRDTIVFSNGWEDTYTPTLTNTTNIAASTAYVTHYKKVGDWVEIWGKVAIDATSSLSVIEMGMELPISSTLSDVYDLSGVAVYEDNTSLQIKADVSNGRAVFRGIPQTSSNNVYSFNLRYKIL